MTNFPKFDEEDFFRHILPLYPIKRKETKPKSFTIMTREEYLNQMQSYREELQEACKKNREALDKLAQEHKFYQREEQERYECVVKQQRNAHTENQHRVERKMHQLKVQWAKEHPIEEVKVVVVEND